MLEFTPAGKKPERMLCCSNKRFVNAFKAASRRDFDKAVKSPYIGIKTMDPLSTKTYDLVGCRIKTVPLQPNTWYVVNAWMFSDQTLPAIVPLVQKCLSR